MKSPSKDEKSEVDELNAKLTKLRATVDGLEKERNFYFGKLRTIEVLCQQDETKDAETKGKILQVLYSTEEEEKAPEAETTGESTEQAENTQTDEQQQNTNTDENNDNLLDQGVNEGELVSAEEPPSF